MKKNLKEIKRINEVIKKYESEIRKNEILIQYIKSSIITLGFSEALLEERKKIEMSSIEKIIELSRIIYNSGVKKEFEYKYNQLDINAWKKREIVKKIDIVLNEI